jgi:hypothetical protein
MYFNKLIVGLSFFNLNQSRSLDALLADRRNRKADFSDGKVRRWHKHCADGMSRGLKCEHAKQLPEVLACIATAITEVVQCIKAFTEQKHLSAHYLKF